MQWPAAQAPFQGQSLGLVTCLDPDANEDGDKDFFLCELLTTDRHKVQVGSCVYENRDRKLTHSTISVCQAGHMDTVPAHPCPHPQFQFLQFQFRLTVI